MSPPTIQGCSEVERLVPIYGDLPGDEWSIPVCQAGLDEFLRDHLLAGPDQNGGDDE